MKFGTLTFEKPAATLLLAPATRTALANDAIADQVLVAPIDASLSDTAAFCDAYQIQMDIAANCVILEAKRGDSTWYAACLILATDRADINGVIRKTLGARKISFAPMDTAIKLTGMEFGGITPVGLPADWPILIDKNILDVEHVIIGSGVRGSKILIKTTALASLPNTTILDMAKKDG